MPPLVAVCGAQRPGVVLVVSLEEVTLLVGLAEVAEGQTEGVPAQVLAPSLVGHGGAPTHGHQPDRIGILVGVAGASTEVKCVSCVKHVARLHLPTPESFRICCKLWSSHRWLRRGRSSC